MKYRVTREVKIEGKTYPRGITVEFTPEKAEEYADKGYLRRVKKEIDRDELQGVDGIGPALSEDIVKEYDSEEELLSKTAQEIARDVDGISVEVATRLTEEYG